MSKLREQIIARCTNRRIAEPLRKLNVESTWRILNEGVSIYALEYILSASFVARGYVKNDSEKELLIKNAINTICEDVFGEFRTPLIELEEALWERDFERAMDVLLKIRKQMFL